MSCAAAVWEGMEYTEVSLEVKIIDIIQQRSGVIFPANSLLSPLHSDYRWAGRVHCRNERGAAGGPLQSDSNTIKQANIYTVFFLGQKLFYLHFCNITRQCLESTRHELHHY